MQRLKEFSCQKFSSRFQNRFSILAVLFPVQSLSEIEWIIYVNECNICWLVKIFGFSNLLPVLCNFGTHRKNTQRSLGQNRKLFFAFSLALGKQGSEKFLDSSLCNSHQNKPQGRCNVFVELLQVNFSLFNPRKSIKSWFM